MSATEIALAIYLIGFAPAVPLVRFAISEDRRKNPDSGWVGKFGPVEYGVAFLLLSIWPILAALVAALMIGALVLLGLDEEEA